MPVSMNLFFVPMAILFHKDLMTLTHLRQRFRLDLRQDCKKYLPVKVLLSSQFTDQCTKGNGEAESRSNNGCGGGGGLKGGR